MPFESADFFLCLDSNSRLKSRFFLPFPTSNTLTDLVNKVLRGVLMHKIMSGKAPPAIIINKFSLNQPQHFKKKKAVSTIIL